MWTIYMYLLMMLDTLLLRLSPHFTHLHFTPLHYTCRHFTSSHLNFTQLHFTTLSFGLTPSKFPTAPFHLTSLHCNFRWFLPHFYSFNFTPFIIEYVQGNMKYWTWHIVSFWSMCSGYVFSIWRQNAWPDPEAVSFSK